MSQHQIEMKIVVDNDTKTLAVSQKNIFFNQTNDTLKSIVLNDWNNAYSSNNSLLSKRFSDQFIRSFQSSTAKDRGLTQILSVRDLNRKAIVWKRPENAIDLIQLQLEKPILPNEKFEFQIDYTLKIPNSKFTGFGFNEKGEMNLKDFFLSFASYENGAFVKYSNASIDDIANSPADYDINLSLPKDLQPTTDLECQQTEPNWYQLKGNFRNNFRLFLQPKSDFNHYTYDEFEVLENLDTKLNDPIKKVLIIEKIVQFGSNNLGKYPYQKIIISQNDYEQNPFYGLNQLPSILNPFEADFVYELKFLKTYLNNYLHTSLHLDPRKDNWIYDGIQVYCMMKYMEQYYPDAKMMGSIAGLKILKSFHLINLNFNDQYSYFYMLMARINLDQTIGDSKDTFIRFNEKIAGKYRAGLSFKYLESYLENDILQKSIAQFIALNKYKKTTKKDFENILKANSPQKIDWFFETLINSRKPIDYKIKKISKTKDSLLVTIKNKSNAIVPIPIYGLKNGKIVFKKWLDNIKKDSTFVIQNDYLTQLVLNYTNEVPEFNLRNNFKKLEGFLPNNRPFKITFMKDLENPKFNQILFVPAFNYNLYDGITAGIRLHNSTMLTRPFNFDIEPVYGIKSKSIIGSFTLSYSQYPRESRLYAFGFGINGATAHYAPDALYTRLNPVVSFSFREKDFRNNHRFGLTFRQIIVNRGKSSYVQTNNTEDYSIFNARFGSSQNELTKNLFYSTDFQAADKFSKISATVGFRKLFDNQRQIGFRGYAGTFLYHKTTTDFFSFALDRPTDYLFDYSYIGRSENSGLFSQQMIIAEGGFKTKVSNSYANQWIVATNATASLWNWVEVYADLAVYKNKNTNPKFAYDSGIRLNLVQDYFELYFPVYSVNGWDIGTPNYSQKIRFIVTISTNTILSLFTRKWF